MMNRLYRISSLILRSALLGLMLVASTVFAQTVCDIQFNEFDGSAPFDADDTAGNDSGVGNDIVRTNDAVVLQFVLSTSNGPESNVRFSFDLDPGLELEELPVFCLDASDGVSPPSTLTGDPNTTGQSVLCNVGDFAIPTASQYTFPAKVMSTNPNGGTVGYSNVVASGDTVCTYSDATQRNFTVSARPQLDVYKQHLNVNGRADGPNGEPGIIYSYSLLLRLFEGAIGNELVADPVIISDDLSTIAPGARLYQGWAGAPTTACFADYNPTGYVGSWPYAYQQGQAPVGTSSSAIAPAGLEERGIYDSGDISCVDSGPASVATITITGADLTGDNAPTRARNNGALAADQRWLANHRVLVWYPVQDVLDAGGVLNTSNTYDLQAVSISGQPNDEPNITDNTRTFQQLAGGSGARSINNYYRRFSTDPIAPRGALPGDSPTDRNRGNVYENYNWYGFTSVNHATRNATDNNINEPFEDALHCNAWDNTRTKLAACDSAAWLAAYPTGANQITHDGTYSMLRRVQTGSLPVGSNMPTDTPVFEYAASTDFGEGMTCEDADETWYSDPNLVPGGIEAVNKVRVIADHTWTPNTPSQANSLFQLWTCFVTDDQAMLGDKVPMNSYVHPGYGNSNTHPYAAPTVSTRGIDDSNEGVYTSSRLYAEATVGGVIVRVDKEESTGATSVLAGDTITYDLNWTLTLDVQVSTTSDVTLTDTLGQGLEYVIGSATTPPSSVVYNADGTTTLTWNFTNITVNEPQDIISYDATILSTAEDASSVINTAIISAPTDASSEAARTDVESLVVVNPTLFAVDKEVLTPIVGADGIVQFRLSYLNNATTPVNNIRFIDILPDVTLLNPPSAYAGSIDFASVTETSGTLTFYYSKNDPATMPLDPADPANDLSTGSITWCDNFDGTGVATNGAPATDCPQNNTEVEAVYIFRPTMAGLTGPDYVTITMQANNISQDEVFRNHYGLAADELGATLVTESVAAIVGVADLELTKTVDRSALPPGENAVFTITVTNMGDDADPNVVVTDLLTDVTGTATLTYVSDDSGGTYDSTTGIWNVGALGIGATNNSKTLNIVAQVNGSIGDTVTNYAEITSQFLLEKDSDTGTDRDTDDLADGIADDDEDSAMVTLTTFDYGDAPVTYPVIVVGIDPAMGLYIGSTLPDNDNNHAGDGTVATTTATDDDAEGGTVNEEDGIPTNTNFAVDPSGLTVTRTVPVVNTTGAPADLTWSVDFNADGDFDDPNETVTVVVAPGDTSATLSLTGYSTTAALNAPVQTYTRLELRNASDFGEIEDAFVNLVVPALEVTKELTDVEQNDDGSVRAEFTIIGDNIGAFDLYDITLTDSLTAGFGSYAGSGVTQANLPYGAYIITAAPALTAVDTGSVITLASGYDGDANDDLVVPVAGDILQTGDEFTIVFEITFKPDLNNPTSRENSAVLTGDIEEDGVTDGDVTDISDDPNDPTNIDPNLDGNPDDPTVVPFTPTALIGVSKAVDEVAPNGDGTFDINFEFFAENYGNVPLYDIQLVDDLTTVPNGFGSYVAGTPTNPGEFTISGALFATDINDNFPTGNVATLVGNINAGYTGNGATADSEFFSVTAGNRLDPGDRIRFEFTVQVYPDFDDNTIDYLNQATVSGNSIEGNNGSEVTDLSDDGTDPDPDGDGDPTEDGENNPTDTNLSTFINAVPAIAKQATNLSDNGNGTFDLSFIFNIANVGNVPLYDVQINDDLTFGFGSLNTGTLAQGEYNISSLAWISAAPDLTLNSGFNGSADQNLLTLTASDALDVGETAMIQLDITFFPDIDAPNFGINSAIIVGDSIENGTAGNDPNGGSDISDDGTNPDSDGDGDPSETPSTDPSCIADNTAPGCEDDPTIVMVPIIGTSKVIASGPTNNNDGTFTVAYDLFIENLGNVDLHDVSLTDDVTVGFGSHVTTTPTAPGTYTVTAGPSTGAVGAGSTIAVNSGFDGDSDTELLDYSGADVLAIGEMANIKFTIRFFPDPNLANFAENQTVATADTTDNGDPTDGLVTTDTSDDQFPPDSNNNGTPTDDDDPTVADVPIIGLSKAAGVTTDNNDGTYTVTFTLLAENLGNVDLFDVLITDDLSDFGIAGTAGSLNAGEYAIDAAPSSPGTLNPNAAFDGVNPTDYRVTDISGAAAVDSIPVGETEMIMFTMSFMPDFAGGIGLDFYNQANVVADTIDDGISMPETSDISDDGSNPDPDGDGNPGGTLPGDDPICEADPSDARCNSDPTPITLAPKPAIATAKSASAVTDNGDGTFDVTFTLIGQNLGNVPLYDISFIDDLSSGFGTYVAGTPANPGEYSVGAINIFNNSMDSVTASMAYTGTAPNTELLDISQGGSLAVAEIFELNFTVTFVYDASLVYENQAIISGDIAEDGTPDGDVTDLSDDGTNPDPDGDGDGTEDAGDPTCPSVAPADNCENDPTPIAIVTDPDISVTKAAADPITDNNDGTFTVDYTVVITNTGNVALYDIIATDDIAAGFGALGTAGSLNPGEYVVSTAPDTSFPTFDDNEVGFDGDADQHLLVDPTVGDELKVGESATLIFSITFFPDFTSTLSYENTVLVTADTIDGDGGEVTTDISDDPNDPTDVNTDGDPDNDPDDPTVITIPIRPLVGIAKDATDATASSTQAGAFEVTFTFTVENFGNVPLYDVQITDDMAAGFGALGTYDALSPGQYAVQASSLSTTLSNLTVNAAFDGDGATPDDINLLTLNTSDNLAVGETGTLEVTIQFYPDFFSGTTTFENSATITGDPTEDGTAGNDPDTVTDDSVDGTDPDGDDNDGDPDESSPTPVTIITNPQLGVAKEAIVTGRDITMNFTLENMGDVILTSISMPDNLDAVFGVGNYTFNSISSSTGTLHNAGFNGSSVTELVNNTATLAVGVTETITIEITLDIVTDQGNGLGVYENQVTGTAEDPLGNDTTDDSEDGTDPDGTDGDDDPTNNSTPTPILVGNLELNKALGYVRATGVEDQYEAEFIFTLLNNGAEVLNNITLTDDFAGQNSAVLSVDAVSGTITPTEVDVANSFTATSFDTSFVMVATGNAFSGGDAVLDPGDSVVVSAIVQFTIDPVTESVNPITNSALATGDDPNGGTVDDISDDNTPTEDTDGDGDPSNDPITIPIEPTGVVYDSSTGLPIEGAVVTLTTADGTPLPELCLVNGQQGQTTEADGEYRFDILYGADPACPAEPTEYMILIEPPLGYVGPSTAIPAIAGSYDASSCPAVNGTCEVADASPVEGGVSGTGNFDHYMGLLLGAGDPNVVYNHIPLDPAAEALLVRKKSNVKSASLGDVVVWTIEVQNNAEIDSVPATITDTLPLGLSYVAGTSTIEGVAQEPTLQSNKLHWYIGAVTAETMVTIRFATRINPAVVIGKMTNLAQAFNEDNIAMSNQGTATIEIIPEHVFDCGEVIGQVFDDTDLDGYQDEGEVGVPGVELYTLQGLKITTDKHGRYHIPCAAIPNHSRGSNFSIKLDTDTLPTGFRMTSENPRTIRLTRGKISKANFGVNPMHVLSITLTDDLFTACDDTINAASEQKMIGVLQGLIDQQSVLRVSYYAINADAELAANRIEHFINVVQHIWHDLLEAPYRLEIEYDIIMDDATGGQCDPEYVAPSEPEPEAEVPEPVLPEKRQYRVYFKHDSSSISETATAILDSANHAIKTHDYRSIKIEAHTDTSGSQSYNQRLSNKRLKNVERYLDTKGIEIQRQSAGEENLPIMTEDNIRTLENRVVIITLE